MGLLLKNPIIASSAGTTEKLEQMKKAEEAGAGAVIMKSFFERKDFRSDHTPHFIILKRKLGTFRADTLYSCEQASSFDETEYAEEIVKAKKELSIPVIANIDCYNYQESIRIAKMFAEAGADALEIKACPTGELSLTGSSYQEVIGKVLQGLKEEIKIPITVKLVGQLDDPVKTALYLEKKGANGITLFNRLAALDIDIQTETPIMHGGYAGHGGLWSIYYSLRWISALYPVSKLPICGSGGAYTGEDVIKYLLSGACSVAICTSILLNGYEVIGKIKKELTEWMEKKNYRTIEEFRGKAAARVNGNEDIIRGKRVEAWINDDKCSLCGKCFRSCFHSAIDFSDNYCRVIAEKCAGCGLCLQVCPSNAIELKRIYLI
jgi:dihydroorotate dehydrogenase (fumarate)